jgi:hypothetical protein
VHAWCLEQASHFGILETWIRFEQVVRLILRRASQRGMRRGSEGNGERRERVW